jgi:hypothetical protein
MERQTSIQRVLNIDPIFAVFDGDLGVMVCNWRGLPK